MPQQLDAPTRPAEQHQAGQAALVSLIPALLRQAWPLLDLHDLQATLPAFTAAVRAIVQRYGQASAAAALSYYQSERAAAAVPGRPVTKLAPTPADSVIEDAVKWATTDLYGPVTPASQAVALSRLDASVSQLVLGQGQATVVQAVQQDRYARAWARVPEADACSFCMMLAMRGATYKDERAVGRGSNSLLRKNGKAFASHYLAPSDFKVHDHCRCHVEPVFGAYEPSARVREMTQVWKDSTTGRSGNDARNAFRQALEGRPVLGTTGPLKPKVPDRAQAEFYLAQTQRMTDSPWRTKRLAELHKVLGQ